MADVEVKNRFFEEDVVVEMSKRRVAVETMMLDVDVVDGESEAMIQR